MQITRFVIFISLFLRITGIILKDGGYEDVYVLIHESNDESDELLQAIKVSLYSCFKGRQTDHQLN
jgi:hypothetical protein